MPEMYLVGGAVRDLILGVKSHDLDFTVEAESFEDMREFLMRKYGLEIFLEIPEFGTIRGRFPKSEERVFFGPFEIQGQACDFVLARRESHYTDGRHPDSTEPGTLLNDLERRDFTVNAMAMGNDGEIIDPWYGQNHLKYKKLQAVGDPGNRMYEDPLRVFRALRFSVVKGFWIADSLRFAMQTERVLNRMKTATATDRIRTELTQMFAHDTMATFRILDSFSRVRDYVFNETGIWLKPTVEER